MTYMIILSLVAGILCGYFLLPANIMPGVDTLTTVALNILVLSVGIDIGSNKQVFHDLQKAGLKILLVPAAIIIGSLAGGAVAGFIYKMPTSTGLAIASGFGWYSLSGVLLSDIANIEIGTIAFLTNVMRELITVVTVPILAHKLNYITAIAPAGATSMDSTLPLIAEETDRQTVLIAFINGVILSSLVPILVPLLYKMA